MKRMIALTLILALAVVLPASTLAQQQGAPVYLVPNASIATTPFVTGTAADSGTVNKQLTVTITPPAGQHVYVVGWDWSACQDATSTVGTNLTFTTTGFTNLPKIGHFSLAATANICAAPGSMNLGAWPMKSQSPGTAVTFVSPAAKAQMAYTLNVYAFFAP